MQLKTIFTRLCARISLVSARKQFRWTKVFHKLFLNCFILGLSAHAREHSVYLIKYLRRLLVIDQGMDDPDYTPG